MGTIAGTPRAPRAASGVQLAVPSPVAGSLVAEAAMRDHARYDQYVEWGRPVLQKYGAKPSAPAFAPQV